jgi:hypothetical protein
MIANSDVRRLLLTFLQGWSATPDATDFRNVRLDLRRNEEVNGLCHRIAADPCLALHREPEPVLAVLLMRIVTAIEISEGLAAGTVVIDGPPTQDDQEAMSVIFDVLLPALPLEKTLDGRIVEAVWIRSDVTRH